MNTAILHCVDETPDEKYANPRYYISYHHDEMPAHSTSIDFAFEDAARGSEPTLVWEMPDEDSDPDVIAVAYYA